MDLMSLFGIISGIMGVFILFLAHFLWIPKGDFSAMIKISQNKGKIKAFIVVFLIIFVLWLIILIKLLLDFFF